MMCGTTTKARTDYLNSYIELKKSIKVFTEELVIYTIDKETLKIQVIHLYHLLRNKQQS